MVRDLAAVGQECIRTLKSEKNFESDIWRTTQQRLNPKKNRSTKGILTKKTTKCRSDARFLAAGRPANGPDSGTCIVGTDRGAICAKIPLPAAPEGKIFVRRTSYGSLKNSILALFRPKRGAWCAISRL